MNYEASSGLPGVDVIVPFHSVNSLLLQSLESLQSSVEISFRIVLVNDSPQVDIPEKILNIDNYKIVRTVNRGYKSAIFSGLAEATAPLVAFLDSDDITDPSRLFRQVKQLVSTGADLSTCGIQKFRTTKFGNRRRLRSSIGPTATVTHPRTLLIISSTGADSTLVVRRNILNDVIPFFQEAPAQFADYTMIASLDSRIKFSRLPQKLYWYRMSEEQMSRGVINNEGWNTVHAAWKNNLDCVAEIYPCLRRYVELPASCTFSLLNGHRIHGISPEQRSNFQGLFKTLNKLKVSPDVIERVKWKICIEGRRFLCLRRVQGRTFHWFVIWFLYVCLSLFEGNKPRKLKT